MINAVRVFLLVVILVGLGLIATYSLWVPKVVEAILTHESSFQGSSSKEAQPMEVVKALYTYWLLQVQEPHFDPHNRAYARRDLVTERFIQTVDAKVRDQNFNSDPIFCAQDIPQKIEYTEKSYNPNTAKVVVTTHYDRPYDISVTLINQQGVWKVDSIICPSL